MYRVPLIPATPQIQSNTYRVPLAPATPQSRLGAWFTYKLSSQKCIFHTGLGKYRKQFKKEVVSPGREGGAGEWDRELWAYFLFYRSAWGNPRLCCLPTAPFLVIKGLHSPRWLTALWLE